MQENKRNSCVVREAVITNTFPQSHIIKCDYNLHDDLNGVEWSGNFAACK